MNIKGCGSIWNDYYGLFEKMGNNNKTTTNLISRRLQLLNAALKTKLSVSLRKVLKNDVRNRADNFLIQKAFKFFDRNSLTDQSQIAKEIKDQVKQFEPYVPIIVALRNQGMRPRHWKQVGSALGLEDFEPSDDFTLTKLLELNPASQEELITKVSEAAAKEFNIEQTLDNMLADWTGLELQIFPYRDTGTGVLKGVDEIQAILDEHVTMTQARARRFVEVPSTRGRRTTPDRVAAPSSRSSHAGHAVLGLQRSVRGKDRGVEPQAVHYWGSAGQVARGPAQLDVPPAHLREPRHQQAAPGRGQEVRHRQQELVRHRHGGQGAAGADAVFFSKIFRT